MEQKWISKKKRTAEGALKHKNRFEMQAQKTFTGGAITVVLGLVFIAVLLQSIADYLDPTKYHIYPSVKVFNEDTPTKRLSRAGSLKERYPPYTGLNVTYYLRSSSISEEMCNATLLSSKVSVKLLQTNSSIPFSAWYSSQSYGSYCHVYWQLNVASYMRFKDASGLPHEAVTFQVDINDPTNTVYFPEAYIISNVTYVDNAGVAESTMNAMPIFKQYLYQQRYVCRKRGSGNNVDDIFLTGKLFYFTFKKDWIDDNQERTVPYSKVLFFSDGDSLEDDGDDDSGDMHVQRPKSNGVTSTASIQMSVSLKQGNTYSVETTSFVELGTKLIGIIGGLMALESLIRNGVHFVYRMYLKHVVYRILSILLMIALTATGIILLNVSLQNQQKSWIGPKTPTLIIQLIIIPSVLMFGLFFNTVCCYHRHYLKRRQEAEAEEDSHASQEANETTSLYPQHM